MKITYTIIYLFLLQSLALSQSSYNTTFLSRWLINEGPVTSIDARGDTVYFSSGFNLKIADFSIPSNPILLNKILYFSRVTKVRHFDNYLIILKKDSGITVLDVEDPMNIEDVYGLPDTHIKNFEIKINSDTVYLYLLYNTYFKTIIITDPNHPQQIVNFPVPSSYYIFDVAITNNSLCLLNGGKISIVDVSSPSNPVLQGEYIAYGSGLGCDEGWGISILANNNFVYATFHYNCETLGYEYEYDGVDILDITDPSQPLLVKDEYNSRWGNGVFIDDKLYMVNGNFEIFSLSNQAFPQLLHTYNTSGTASDIAIYGSNAFIADRNSGVLEIDITNTPVLIGQYSFEIDECEIIEVKLLNDYAYLIDGYYGGPNVANPNKLRVIDVSNSYTPIQVGQLSLFSQHYRYAFDIAANGYAYFITTLDSNIVRLHTIDVRDPTNIVEVATFDLLGDDVSDLAVYGNHLYACLVTSIVILDISDPLNPGICGTVIPDKGARLIDIKDDRVFVSSRLYNYWDSKFYIYDLSDPCNPNELSSAIIPHANDLVIDLSAGNGLLTVIRSSIGYVYQVSDPSNPLFLQTIEKTDFYHQFLDVNIYDNYLYLTESTYGVRIFDIGDAQNIEEIAYYRNLGALRTDASSNKFYVASRELGLEIIRNDLITAVEQENGLPTEFALSQNYPNPFNPSTKIKFTIPQSPLPGGDGRGGLVTLKVYDLLGREVATLVNEEKPVGNYEVEFSANGGGEGLPSGIYFYQLLAGNYIETKKMVLLK